MEPPQSQWSWWLTPPTTIVVAGQQLSVCRFLAIKLLCWHHPSFIFTKFWWCVVATGQSSDWGLMSLLIENFPRFACFFCFACTPGKVRNEWKMGNLRLKKVGWFSNLWIVLLFFMVNCRWRCGGQEGSITSPLGFEVGGERSRPYWVYSLYTLYFIFYFLRPTTFIYLTLRLRYWVAFYWGRCHTGVKQIYGPD